MLENYDFFRKTNLNIIKVVRYISTAIPVTVVYFKLINNSEAKTAPITEAHPLIPQAQGIPSLKCFSNQAKPKGKGIPIKNAYGAINKTDIINFIISLDEKNALKIGVRKKR